MELSAACHLMDLPASPSPSPPQPQAQPQGQPQAQAQPQPQRGYCLLSPGAPATAGGSPPPHGVSQPQQSLWPGGVGPCGPPSAASSGSASAPSPDLPSDADLFWPPDLKLFGSAVSAGNGIGGSSVARRRPAPGCWGPAETPQQMKLARRDGGEGDRRRQTPQQQQQTHREPPSPAAAAAAAGATGNSCWPDELAAELDGSLSGLGAELSAAAASYAVGESLLGLPSLPVFKQEAPSPTHNDTGLAIGPSDAVRCPAQHQQQQQQQQQPLAGGMASQLHQLLQQHAAVAAAAAAAAAVGGGVSVGSPAQASLAPGALSRNGGGGGAPVAPHTLDAAGTGLSLLGGAGDGYGLHLGAGGPGCGGSAGNGIHAGAELSIDCRFQYVLAAATSIATKVNEETLTYLNQGQSYEIKLKKLGELSAYRGKVLKSAIRICFHERRLQYTEREQMLAWQASRPNDRIVEVDVPLSYGLLDVSQSQDPSALNAVEFLWDPTKEVGVYIKVNCISTEFTPKKHGGEKGVPFRIQVETFLQGDGGPKRLHAAACQVKVFKLKGADRKHKQDREKILKRPPSEQDKFQPSYECTVLSDIPADALVLPQPLAPVASASAANGPSCSPSDVLGGGVPAAVCPPPPSCGPGAGPHPSPPHQHPQEGCGSPPGSSPQHPQGAEDSAAADGGNGVGVGLPPQQPAADTTTQERGAELCAEGEDETAPLPGGASAAQTAAWLQRRRFGAHLAAFRCFSGPDLLRLTREDLIQICGLPDGIRLFNALHAKNTTPRLTVYVRTGPSPSAYRALYLAQRSAAELSQQLGRLLNPNAASSPGPSPPLLLLGPASIHVLVTDEVVHHLADHSAFSLELAAGEPARLLLRPALALAPAPAGASTTPPPASL